MGLQSAIADQAGRPGLPVATRCDTLGGVECLSEIVLTRAPVPRNAGAAAAGFQGLQDQRLIQQQRMDALDCLAGGIAHEFNNVLQAVRGYVAFAMDEQDEDSQAYADLLQALAATDRAAALTRSLLDFARADEPMNERHRVSEEIAALEKLFRPVLGEHIMLGTHFSRAPIICLADSQGLRQTLLNLCINARDAMPGGGELLVSAELFVVEPLTQAATPGLSEGQYCRLQVTDSGGGIPAACLDKVFDPFFTTKEVGRGTGLGLATVYGFVQRSGGRVTVYSEEGRGSTFALYLPVEEIPGMDYEPTRPELLADQPHTVLLVEDNPQVLEVGRRSLEQAGYRVLVADNGEQGLEAYAENIDDVALVVLDSVLPRLSGRRVFEEIRRLQSNVPVVFTTGYDPLSLAGKSDGHLADLTLAKPYDRQQLLQAAKSLLAADRHRPVSVVG